MIPFDDLSTALRSWRHAQGLPVAEFGAHTMSVTTLPTALALPTTAAEPPRARTGAPSVPPPPPASMVHDDEFVHEDIEEVADDAAIVDVDAMEAAAMSIGETGDAFDAGEATVDGALDEFSEQDFAMQFGELAQADVEPLVAAAPYGDEATSIGASPGNGFDEAIGTQPGVIAPKPDRS